MFAVPTLKSSCNVHVPPAPLNVKLPNIFPPVVMVVLPEVPVNVIAELVLPLVYVIPATNLNVAPLPVMVNIVAVVWVMVPV